MNQSGGKTFTLLALGCVGIYTELEPVQLVNYHRWLFCERKTITSRNGIDLLDSILFCNQIFSNVFMKLSAITRESVKFKEVLEICISYFTWEKKFIEVRHFSIKIVWSRNFLSFTSKSWRIKTELWIGTLVEESDWKSFGSILKLESKLVKWDEFGKWGAVFSIYFFLIRQTFSNIVNRSAYQTYNWAWWYSDLMNFEKPI